MQIIGDFLVVGVQNHVDGDSIPFQVRMYDLSSLNQSPPRAPSGVTILSIPSGEIAATNAAITDVPTDKLYRGSLGGSDATGSGKKYILGEYYYTHHTLRVYRSRVIPGLSSITNDTFFTKIAEIEMPGKEYDNMMFFRDKNDDIWLFAYRGVPTVIWGLLGFEDYVDLYKLTYSTNNTDRVFFTGPLMPNLTRQLTMDHQAFGMFDISVRYGVGMNIYTDYWTGREYMAVRATERNLGDGPPYAVHFSAFSSQ